MRWALPACLVVGASLVSVAKAQLRAVEFATNLGTIVDYEQDPLDPRRAFVLRKNGTILTLYDDVRLATAALTLPTADITTDGEKGLLGIAFAPDQHANRDAYIYYNDNEGAIRIQRITRPADNLNIFDAASRFNVMRIPHSRINHTGGTLAFGFDGFLYIATGDGGGSNDPDRNGQAWDTLLGKMLRIQVGVDLQPGDPDNNYGIPNGNPFVGGSAILDEIYAVGLRNPFKWSVDAYRGDFIIGDVGQANREEVSKLVYTGGAANFGWPKWEGTRDNGIGTLLFEPHTPPVFEYDRTIGSSITGGVMARGLVQPMWANRYFFGDYGSESIFSVDIENLGNVAGTLVNHSTALGINRAIVSVDRERDGDLVYTNLFGTLIRLEIARSPGMVVFRRNDTGQLAVFERFADTRWRPTSAFASPAWQYVASGDMDKDGVNDAVMWNPATGRMGFYRIVGTQLRGWTGMSAYVSPGWTPVDLGDMDKDGNLDVVLFNAGTRTIGMYRMNGPSSTGWATLARPSAGWNPVAVGDLDRDGNQDLLLRQDGTGRFGVWAMNRTRPERWIWWGPSTSPLENQFIGLGDLNRDDRLDLVFATPSRRLFAWAMAGNAVVASITLSDNYSPDWTPVDAGYAF